MIFKDKEAKKQLRIINHRELTESINTYPEDERNGKSDLQVLLQEAEYYLDMYNEDTVFYDDLKQAKELLAETQNGKVIPCWRTIPPTPKYSEIQLKIKVDEAKNIINEYNRLKRGVERLRRSK